METIDRSDIEKLRGDNLRLETLLDPRLGSNNF